MTTKKSVKKSAKKTINKATKKAAAEATRRSYVPKTSVVPDSIDLRDRVYMPSVMLIPAQQLPPKIKIPVLNQHDSSACTGFALASVIYHLLYKAEESRQKRRGKRIKVEQVSPFMLYSMARRYDEFPGNSNKDSGSSLRGGVKGWYKYGACAADLWQGIDVPAPSPTVKRDWWQDAVRRPMGAYYRIDVRSVTDMQVALNEIGVLYASAACHSGWMQGIRPKQDPKEPYWVIPYQKATPKDGAHAFAIVGYTQKGFIVHNSWDTDWGTDGHAVLAYEDWVENAMDCWVAQLGVMTKLHQDIAEAPTLRMSKTDGKVELASDETLRNRELDPFIIDMENNGKLSNTGDFRTLESDLDSLLTQQLPLARTKWKLADEDVMDVAIYAHGGLTSEQAAANTAAKWIKAMYDRQIFPIFLMWETDLWSTLKDMWDDAQEKQARMTGAGLMDKVGKWWDERLEKLLAVPGSKVWGEMKDNANKISQPGSGVYLLFEKATKFKAEGKLPKIRLHLIGHSAGAIVNSYIVDRLNDDWEFATVNFMAPAVTLDLFNNTVVPKIKNGKVHQYNQFELKDEAEQKDPTCKPILGYNRSLLYLVSNSFEDGLKTPILGMETYFKGSNGPQNLANVFFYDAPGDKSNSTTHGGFDDDDKTRETILSLIKPVTIVVSSAAGAPRKAASHRSAALKHAAKRASPERKNPVKRSSTKGKQKR